MITTFFSLGRYKLKLLLLIGVLTIIQNCKDEDDPKPDYSKVTVSTFAGSVESGFQDGQGADARFNFPAVLKFDSKDNLFVADRQNYAIRKITPEGKVSTFYKSSSIFRPNGMVFDGTDNLFVSTLAGEILKFTPDGAKTVIAGSVEGGYVDGNASEARFDFPTGLVLDQNGNLMVADLAISRIRKVTMEGQTTTIAGDGSLNDFKEGVGIQASLGGGAWDIAMNREGDFLLTLFDNNRVVKMSSGGVVTAFAGTGAFGFEDGKADAAVFKSLYAITVDRFGNALVVDSGNHAIRLISPQGEVTTIAGSGTAGSANGNGKVAQFSTPSGIAINSKGEVFVGERNSFTIRKIVIGQ